MPAPLSSLPIGDKRRRSRPSTRGSGVSVRDQRLLPLFPVSQLDRRQEQQQQEEEAEEGGSDGAEEAETEPFPELTEPHSAAADDEQRSAEQTTDDSSDDDEDGSRRSSAVSVSAAPPSFDDEFATAASSMRLLAPPSPTARSLAYESDSSGDENETGRELRYKNRIGAVPLQWYKDDAHIGYDAAGHRIIRKQQADAIDAFLSRVAADSRHSIYDAINDEHVTLTADELASLQRIRRGGYAHIAFDPYADYDREAYTSEVRHEAIGNPQEPKRRFVPSAWEAKRVVRLVRAMRNGWLRSIEDSQAARAKKREQQHAAFLMWGSDGQLLSEAGEERTGLHRMPPSIPPPKLALPGHAHSYNPPAEYLMSAEEEEQWRQQDPADRPLDFLPRRYSALRLIPAYSDYVKERFERCLTGDHRVLSSSGWKSITAMRVGDVVLSFNVSTYAMEWKPVIAVQSHRHKAGEQLYRMQGSGMDVIATRDHRMLLARLTSDGLHARQPVGYETVDQLLKLAYTSSGLSKHSRAAHSQSRAVVCTGFNQQPAVKVVIPGMERVCDWWWDKDGQVGFLHFLGFWLGDGWLGASHGMLCVGQQNEAAVDSLNELLDAVFPRWWHRTPQWRSSSRCMYVIHCPPLYDYLRLMAVGPPGYNPRDPTQRRSYPHFTYESTLAAQELLSVYGKLHTEAGWRSSWTEDAMLASMSAEEERCALSPPSPTLPLPSTPSTGTGSRRRSFSLSRLELNAGQDDAASYESCERDGLMPLCSGECSPPCPRGLQLSCGRDEKNEEEAAEVAELDIGGDAAGEVAWWHNGEWVSLDGRWFCFKRWLGDEQQIATVYSQLSREQAIALLDGFCRVDGKWARIEYVDSIVSSPDQPDVVVKEPTGVWRCSSSSMPLIDHLQLVGQLAGAAVDLQLHTQASKTTTIDGSTVSFSVDQWELAFSFTKSRRGIPMQTVPLAQPVDVSDDIDGRGYYQYEDDGRVYDITVKDNSNFLTQRLCKQRQTSGHMLVKAQCGFTGNCLDLYLCPRVRRRKLHVDPQSLIPALPKPAELRPFPTTLAVRYVGHTGRVRSVAVDSSGEWLASGAEDGSVRLWELSTGRCFKRWDIRPNGGETSSGGRLRDGSSAADRPTAPVIEHVSFCPDVRRPLLSVCVGQFVLLLRTGTGSAADEASVDGLLSTQTAEQREHEEDSTGHSRADEAERADGSSSKQYRQQAVWTARREAGGDIKGFSVGVVRQPDDDEEEEEEGKDGSVDSQPRFADSSLSADGDGAQSSVAAADDGSRVVLVVDVGHLVTHLSWHAKGDYFATTSKPSSASSRILIHRLSAHASHSPFSKQKGAVSCCSFHPTQPFFLLAARSSVHVYHLVKQLLVKRLLTPMQLISSMAVHPSGDHVLVSSFDRKVCWFDLDMGQSPYKTLKYHQRAVRRVAFHPHYPLFASAADDGCVHIFHATVYSDLLTNATIVPLKIIRAHSVTDQLGVLDCCWHSTQPMIVTAGADHAVSLWR